MNDGRGVNLLIGLLEENLHVKIAFGLRQQGHIPTIERMLAEGADWDAIGREIGWCPQTAEQHWNWHLEALREEK